MHRLGRSKVRTVSAATLATALILTACGEGGSAGSSTEDTDVQLRFAFWGSDTRVQNTEEIIEAFNEEHPEIQVDIEFRDWNGFWDNLNTQIAGNDSPDIFQMDAPYLRQYAEQGTLLDLSGVDLSQMPEDIIASGTVDGGYYGLASGVNAVAVVANPRLFEEAGVEMPDDTAWTWEDWSEISSEISENLDDVYGTAGPTEPQLFKAWLRQQGVEFNDEEGQLAFEQSHVQEYFEWLDQLRTDEVLPPAQVMVEEESVSQDQSLEATGQAAMAFTWTNLLGALTDASDEELVLLRLPSPTGEVADAQQWYNTGMISASSGTDHPEEVTAFLDFFVNDPRSAAINMTDRGLSANTAIRDELMEGMDDANRESAQFITDIEDELGDPEPVPATGSGSIADVITRHLQEVFFENMSVEQAAEAAYAELESTIG